MTTQDSDIRFLDDDVTDGFSYLEMRTYQPLSGTLIAVCYSWVFKDPLIRGSRRIPRAGFTSRLFAPDDFQISGRVSGQLRGLHATRKGAAWAGIVKIYDFMKGFPAVDKLKVYTDFREVYTDTTISLAHMPKDRSRDYIVRYRKARNELWQATKCDDHLFVVTQEVLNTVPFPPQPRKSNDQSKTKKGSSDRGYLL